MILSIQMWMHEMIKKHEPQAPVLEVGSFNVNGGLRQFLPEPYLGVDMREGPGVDEVQDILSHTLEVNSFNTVVCAEVLEHCSDPALAVANMHDLLMAGGQLYLTSPFAWPQHEEPCDYWRFTPDGLKVLLDRAGFVEIDAEWGNNRSHAFAFGRKA